MMKSAEEFYHDLPDTHSTTIVSAVKQRDLDAIKEGMRRAAAMIRTQRIHSDFVTEHPGGDEMMAKKIERAADNLKEV
jgi:hypothetical protein